MVGAKHAIAALLRELGELTLLDEQDPNAFRVRAYERAVQGLLPLGDEVATMSAAELAKLPGIGKGTAEKIREFFQSGRIEKLEDLRRRYPPSYRRLARVPDLGPKSMAKLRAALGIESIEQLQQALASKQVHEVAGFGPKRAANLRRALERMQLSDQRWPTVEAMPLARRLTEALRASPAVARADWAGGLRRLCETVHDVDLVVASQDPEGVAAALRGLGVGEPEISSGGQKIALALESGLPVDVRLVPEGVYGAALLFMTGSKAHNIRLRQLAMARGWVLSEYGLAEEGEGGAVIAAATEESIYAALGLPFIPPPMREDSGELDGPLPSITTLAALHGDLHIHTDLSGDGESTLDEMLEHGRQRGYRYMAITDHAEDLPMIGVGRDAMLQQRERLGAAAARFSDLRVLHGAELNIGPEGGLDYDPEFRAGFDWGVAGVHSHFDLGLFEQTKRVITAMRDPGVNVIAHLTGRRLGKRPGIELDFDAVLQAAALTGCALEINSALGRLDVSADVLRRARELAVTFVISTDAHHVNEYDRLQWGAAHAQRGWVEPERVANTWAPERFLAWAKARRASG